VKAIDWVVTTLASLATIASLLFPLHDVIGGKTSPHLSYVVNPTRTVIADPMRTSGIEVKVNGKLSKQRILASQILIYNAGEYAIDQKDLTSDKLRVTATQPIVLIDASVQRPTRLRTTQFRLTRVAAGEVYFTFDLFEHNDAAIIQVVYEDQPKELTFVVAGTLRGQGDARRVIASGARNDERLHEIRARATGLVIGAFFAFGLALGTLYGVLRKAKKVWVTCGIGFFVLTAVLLTWLIGIINPKLPLAF